MVSQIAEMKNLIVQHDIKLISVDVFDTLLLRSSCPELRRFEKFCKLQWQRYLSRTVISETKFFFTRLRVGKELYQKARVFPGQYEVTYEELYRIIALEFSEYIEESIDDFVAGCLRIELEAELSDLYFNKKLWAFLGQQKKMGHEIIFCSDMYLDNESIRYLIENLSNDKLLGKLYVSSDWQKTKRDKSLFEVVIKQSGIMPNEILHIGDNRSSDFDAPLSMGMLAFQYRRSLSWIYISKIKKEIYKNNLNFKGLLP